MKRKKGRKKERWESVKGWGASRRRKETPRMLKNKKKGGRGSEEVGWPKVARVEYWNALPEAISVRCPPFALLSCPLQASSSFPSPSLSLYLSSFLSVLPLCVSPRPDAICLSLFLSSSYLLICTSVSLSLFPPRSFREATQHLSPRA